MSEAPTREEIQKVRRYECSQVGHDWRLVETMFQDVPVKIVCERCGKSASVVEDHRMEGE